MNRRIRGKINSGEVGALYDNGRKNKTTAKCKWVYTRNACRKNECVSFCDCKMGKTVDDLLNEIENENLYKALLTIDRCTLQIVLLKMKGYSTKEIAPIVGLTTGAVYSRLEYLRKNLNGQVKSKCLCIFGYEGICLVFSNGIWQSKRA